MPSARAPASPHAQPRLRAGLARLAILLAAALPAAPAGAEGDAFVTAKGVEVATPAMQTLDCEGMRRVLAAIDSSGYRGARPEPIDPRDRSLMEYENRLSGQFYQRCVHPLIRAQPLFNAFNRGYDPRQ